MMKQLYNITAGNPKKLLKPILWEIAVNLVNMFSMGLMVLIVSTIYAYFTGEQPSLNISIFWIAWGGMVVFGILVFFFEWKSYSATHQGGYEASAEGRAKLAEHLRKLPLGFLISKDPGELGSTMMNDFTLTEEASTDFLPPLVSGVVVPILAFVFLVFIDWRLSLTMLIVLSAGKIVEQGNHEELIKRLGKYYTMWEKLRQSFRAKWRGLYKVYS